MRRARTVDAACGVVALFVSVILSAAVAPAETPSSGTGSGTLEVIRPLRMAVHATLAFGRAAGAQGGTVTVAPTLPATRTSQGPALSPGDTVSPTVATVTGEPRRAYRISLPASVASSPGGYPVSAFTVTSRTSGTVTQSRQAQLDANGSDTLLIGGTLTLPKGSKPQAYAAQVPVTIAYE